jgi:hypothetical protein
MTMGTPTDYMRQSAPWPAELAALVAGLEYRPGWTFELEVLDRGQWSMGLTLVITTLGYNTYHPERGETYRVSHLMPVPPAAYNAASWRWWLFEQLLLVEKHEAMEFFQVAGERPYAPNHGFGWSPYLVTEVATDEDRRTNFRNEVQPE